jgi:hypothetical protein
MQINSISAITPISPRTSVPARPGSTTTSSATFAAPESSTGNASVAVQPVAARAKNGGSATNGGGAALIQQAAAAVSYSTTVGGKNYSGSVEGSDGSYVASIPGMLPPAFANGGSAQLAEANLDNLINILA